MTLQSAALNLIPGFQSLAVMGRGMAMIPKAGASLGPTKLIKGFTGIVIGASLIGPTANIIKSI